MFTKSQKLFVPVLAIVTFASLLMAGPASGVDWDADPGFAAGDPAVRTDVLPGEVYFVDNAVDSLDRIVMAGDCEPGWGDDDFCVVRYTAAGELDVTFGGGDGFVTTDPTGTDNYDFVSGVVVDSLDRVVVAGECDDPVSNDDDFCVVRYTAAGELDVTFGAGGVVMTDPTGDDGDDNVSGVVVDSLDRVVVAGDCEEYDDVLDEYDSQFCMVRYSSDGSLDVTFGSGGIQFYSYPAVPYSNGALAIDDLGRVTVAGVCAEDELTASGCVVRFQPDGNIDLSWGGGDGTVTWDMSADFGEEIFIAEAVSIDSAGNAVVSGNCAVNLLFDFDSGFCTAKFRTGPFLLDCEMERPVPFGDIGPSSYAYGAVACLYELGVTNGTSPSTYSPNEYVTREQMAAFIARLHIDALSGVCPGEQPFGDVAASSYAYGAVACLYELGVTNGTSPSTYSPNEYVTREQMAAFLARFYRNVAGEDCGSVSLFVDVPFDSFAKRDIGCLADLGVTTGTSPENFSPYDNVTREQMAAFIGRLYSVLVQADPPSESSIPWWWFFGPS